MTDSMLPQRFLEAYLEQRQSTGKYTFVVKDILAEIPVSKGVLHQALRRARREKRIVLVRKEFYVIVPPEHRNRGILPVSWFLDDLMAFISRPYYLGVLNAAAIHEAGHQQPQEYFVITTGSGLRNIELKNTKINFLYRKDWPKEAIQQRKVPTGYQNISSPDLTAIDLVKYESRIGGLNRVATILDELVAKLKAKRLTELAIKYVDIPTIQRLGYLLKEVLGQKKLAAPLIAYLKTQKTRKVLLKPSEDSNQNLESIDPWKVIPNITVESEL